MRRFVIIGRTATASGDFLLDDVPGTSGRLDVLLRCLRAAMLTSHGLRRDVVVYFVLLGGARAPRVVRVFAPTIKFLRPDERSLAVQMKKVLSWDVTSQEALAAEHPPFVQVRQGFFVADGGLELVLEDLEGADLVVLDLGGVDIRDAQSLDPAQEVAFVIGDHLGFDEPTRALLAARGARTLSVGPVSLHADDVVTIATNELDRRTITA